MWSIGQKLLDDSSWLDVDKHPTVPLKQKTPLDLIRRGFFMQVVKPKLQLIVRWMMITLSRSSLKPSEEYHRYDNNQFQLMCQFYFV